MSTDGISPPPPVALVTGAARRIGRAIAIDLARHGWTVAVHFNASKAEADAVVAEIERGGGRAIAIAADLHQEDAATCLIPAVVEVLGPIQCLINNASTFENDRVETVTRESWDCHMEVNLRAPFVLTQALIAQLPPTWHANVINILDQRVWNLSPFFTSYTVSKAALWTLTQTLAMALAPRVRVNAVGPGPTLPSARQSQAAFERQWSEMPLSRPVAPEEICTAIRYILDAPSVTGQMIAVDAGQHLGWTLSKRAHAVAE